MLRFLAWSIGALVVLGCVCAAFVWYGIATSFEDEWYTVSTASGGNGNVAVVRSYCEVIDWEVPYLVYVHRANEANADSSLVFSDYADCGAGPHVTWLSPTVLKIKTWPINPPPPEFKEGQPPVVLPPTLKRTRIGDISIVYAVFIVPKHRRVQSLDSGRFAPDARDDR